MPGAARIVVVLTILSSCADTPPPALPQAAPPPPAAYLACPPQPKMPRDLPTIRSVETLREHDAEATEAMRTLSHYLEICREHLIELSQWPRAASFPPP